MSEDVLKKLRWVKRLVARGRAEPKRTDTRALVPWGGERVDVDYFWASAWIELKERQARLTEELKLGSAEWRVSQESGLIEFARTDGAIVRAPVQIIGTWNPAKEQFVWAWDHRSVHPRLRAHAERTRWFGDAHDLYDLTAQRVPATESEAWRLAAVAMKVNATQGIYRAPTEQDGPVVFMTMDAPTLISEPDEDER
jgi:hypothetical protein